MISWKYSFEKVSRELELAKKKKQVLDDLFNKGKISQSTYEDMNKSLTEAVTEIEGRQKALSEKMTAKITELEQQIATLEKFLANTEIEYAAGEIDETLHERESSALTLGLEAAKQQLDVIKEAMADLFPEEEGVVPPSPPAETVEETGEETLEMPLEPQIEAPAEVPEVQEEVQEEVEPVTEEETGEKPMETPATEETETLPETPVEEAPTDEESSSLAEESDEETVTAETSETTESSESPEISETAEAEASAEETPAEGFSSYQGEEETTLEGEETEE